MQTTHDERNERENPDREQASPHEPTEPNADEQRGMLCKPSDRNPPRARVRGIMI